MSNLENLSPIQAPLSADISHPPFPPRPFSVIIESRDCAKPVIISNHKSLILIAGPCQIESHDHALNTAAELQEIAQSLNIQFIYKTSFDKANRTSIESRRGVGLTQALKIFDTIRTTLGCYILTDIHEKEQAQEIKEVVDVIQIPAFLCRQTDLLIAAAQTGKVINIKKGQFVAPSSISQAALKIISSGNSNVLLTERGTCFGYNDLVNDMRGIEVMKRTNLPVIFDATHSIQQPSRLGDQSSGQREFIEPLARAAVAIGIAGIFLETHREPDTAPSDGPCMIQLSQLPALLLKLIRIDQTVKEFDAT